MTDLLEGLNPAQREAVLATEGPLLVLAGPGSGKTRVLTHRIAHLIQQGVDPWRILAVTFTNKAAREMRERLTHLVGEEARPVTMGTFHAICARILRPHAEEIGFDRNFLIYDSDDQRRLVGQAIAELNLNEKSYRPNALHGAISRAKNDGKTPESFRPDGYYEEIVHRVWALYQKKLHANNALDFDDLLLHTERLFRETPRVLESYQRRWRYLHVDEFQDTNLVQYELVRMLGEAHGNLFVVGDIDQCVHPDTLIRMPEGEKPIAQIAKGDRVLAAAGRGSVAPATVQRVYERFQDGVLLEVMLASGRTLRVTPNHVCFARLGVPELALAGPLALAESVAEAAGGAEVAQWARLSEGKKFALMPASNLHPSMIVPVWADGEIAEEEIASIGAVSYRGPVYDLDVAHLHNYIAGGVVVHNSIYAWRGADYRNVMKFEESFPNARTIALEQNYRSTQTILDAATALIRRNRQRKDKGLWSELGTGEKITLFEAYDEREEAQFIVREIDRLKRREGYRNRDFAVIYRTNAQSRALEEQFVRSSVKYIIVGGTRFYERREVKDILAFLRLLHNPADSVALERVINVPPRQIGEKSRSDLTRWAARLGLSPFAALRYLAAGEQSTLLPDAPSPFAGRARTALVAFYRLVEPLFKQLDPLNLPMLIGEITNRIAYEEYLLASSDSPEEARDRWQNVVELQTVALPYEHLSAREALPLFLENVALVSDADSLPDEEFDSVTLMTLHTAKGLEYPVVFIPGVEENILPHSRAQESKEELEEERRLAYVGITRAKHRLYMIHAFQRSAWGRTEVAAPSRFLMELPRETLEISSERSKRPAGTPRASTERREPPRQATPRPSAASATTWERQVRPRAGSAATPAPTTFKAGDKVRHATFGEGVVISSQPNAGDEEVTVVFPGNAPKRLLASFAKLEKL